MFLGRVTGRMVCSVAAEGLSGVPLLWVQPLDKRGAAAGTPFVAADGTRMAGPGELVYWEASREAALTLEPSFVPVDHAIIGIVDAVQLDDSHDDARWRAGTEARAGDDLPDAEADDRRGRRI